MVSPPGGTGLCREDPQGTRPLTHFRALPGGRQKKGTTAPFLLNRIIREPYVKRLSRHILALRAAIFHGSRDNGSAPLIRWSVSGDSGLSVVQGILEAAIFPACCQHLPAFLRCLRPGSCCAYGDEGNYSRQPRG